MDNEIVPKPQTNAEFAENGARVLAAIGQLDALPRVHGIGYFASDRIFVHLSSAADLVAWAGHFGTPITVVAEDGYWSLTAKTTLAGVPAELKATATSSEADLMAKLAPQARPTSRTVTAERVAELAAAGLAVSR